MYSQKLECMIEAVGFLHDSDNPITTRHLEMLKDSIGYDRYSEGLVAGLWVGYLTAKGLVKDLEDNQLSVLEQIDELINYMNEFKGE